MYIYIYIYVYVYRAFYPHLSSMKSPSPKIRQVRFLCDRVLKQRGWREPAWMKIQHPAWRDRVIRANANRGKGTTKGRWAKSDQEVVPLRYVEKDATSISGSWNFH